MKGTTFTDSSLVAWLYEHNLTAVLFSNCGLYRSEFEKAIIVKADFRTSYNYSIDPTRQNSKKAQFSIDGLKGLLTIMILL
jgi:uncharacterized protein YjbI with pentapeptide repeats